MRLNNFQKLMMALCLIQEPCTTEKVDKAIDLLEKVIKNYKKKYKDFLPDPNKPETMVIPPENFNKVMAASAMSDALCDGIYNDIETMKVDINKAIYFIEQDGHM